VELIGKVLEAVSIIIASGTAIYGVQAWRREPWKREIGWGLDDDDAIGGAISARIRTTYDRKLAEVSGSAVGASAKFLRELASPGGFEPPLPP